MKHSAQDAFKTLSIQLTEWVADNTPATLNEGLIAPTEKTAIQICLLPVGWQPAMAEGRGAKERRILADYIVTASAKTPAQAAGMLGDLLINPSSAINTLIPLSSDNPIWRLLNIAPQPALLASCPVLLSAPEKLAKPVTDVIATIAPSGPLSGHIKDAGKAVNNASVSIAGSDRAATTDAQGFFTLGGWCGQAIQVTHRGAVQTFTPDPGSNDLVLSITKEN
ncbi:hypothetical protein [Parasulfitobacter algicola]|uniref:Carboxypeptidase regulatory-like domain-containing protein n=1 Tax=Parasulfitobacter algicola TaxID=2614809 RepID=A0ABX2IXH4_9RHOB|nr:hypothetical protein [Sulfitobacter algicola]NSX55762.1 hypothetical protein [Sulfitobacter algicola]